MVNVFKYAQNRSNLGYFSLINVADNFFREKIINLLFTKSKVIEQP